MRSLIIVCVVFCAFQNCNPVANMRSWSSDHDYDKKFQKVLAMGLINNAAIRGDAEAEIVYAAKSIGLKATNSMSMFPPELGKPFDDIERVKNRLRDNGFDGILTVALIDVKAERYISAQYKYEPLVYYDRFRNYYYRTYETVYRPGYYTQNSEYFIETNFYELAGGLLVWSGRSKVIKYGDLDGYLPTYSKLLFKELKSQGIIAE